VTLEELTKVVRSAGGGLNALDYANALLRKINVIAESKRFSALLAQLSTAREAGDFRGRVLEVNFAELFGKRKGTDALRAENKSVRDAAKEQDLTDDQADKLHDLVSAEAKALERKPEMHEVRELAKLIKQGLL
jgi:hypothetical protein